MDIVQVVPEIRIESNRIESNRIRLSTSGYERVQYEQGTSTSSTYHTNKYSTSTSTSTLLVVLLTSTWYSTRRFEGFIVPDYENGLLDYASFIFPAIQASIEITGHPKAQDNATGGP